MKLFFSLSFIVGLILFQFTSGIYVTQPQPLKLNQIQVIGSHNSYKEAMDTPIMQQLMALDSNQALSLDYQHISLTEQLDLGLRKLEIDVFYDPEGGRYSHPVGWQELKDNGLEVIPLDTNIMNKPGFKVLHVQDIDVRSNCPTLALCLEEVMNWSDAHPNHIPIAISFNAKASEIKSRPDFTKPLPFTSTAYDSMDAEILSVVPRDRIIVPDDIRGDFERLEDAVLMHNWPTLEESKGKLLFVLDERKTKYQPYIDNHPSLKDRVMFVNAEPGEAEAAFVFRNNPIRSQEDIMKLVKKGYLVRTRADAGTKEARMGDKTRLLAALSSGAHFISTDYYLPDQRFDNEYRVQLPHGRVARCNPILEIANCEDFQWE